MALIQFEDLPSTNTPINADNLNNNFNECIKNRAYSTEEEVIGKWIDDKPIYRKVIELNVTSTSYNTSVSNLNIDKVIKIDGISQGNPYTMNYYVSATDNLRVFITSDKKLYVSSGSTYPTIPYTLYVILEYTKLTD